MASIKKLKDGNYFVRVSKGKGKERRFINKKIRGKLSDAQKWAREKETLLDLGHSIEEIKLSFAEYFAKWLKVVSKTVAPATYAQYKEVPERYVPDSVWKLKLADIKPHHLQTIYDDLEKTGLRTASVKLNAYLKIFFNYAIKKEVMRSNPCEKTDVRKVPADEVIVFTEEEAKEFARLCQSVANGLILELALKTGMRPEEYLGLRWRDIDFQRNTISIQQVVCFNRKGGGFYFAPPKTAVSRRQIPVSQSVRDKLMRHKIEQNEKRLKSKLSYAPFDLVFATRIGTPYQSKNIADDYLNPILEKMGIRVKEGGKFVKTKNITLYSLRHTCATLMLINGERPKVVAERLGHASVVLTIDTYSHVLPTMQQDATERMENLLAM